jgi:hypothetical protein
MYKPINTIQINEALSKDYYSKKFFKAVLPIDRLPQRVVYPSAFVINTHNHDEPGEHWLALYYDTNGFCSFFDSYGNPPKHFGLENFIKKTSQGFKYNETQIQGLTSSTCGYYCIYFILLKSRGFELVDIVNQFSNFNYKINDLKILNVL